MLYYLLNYTWGLLTTLLGWLAYAFAHLFLKKKITFEGKFGNARYLMIGENWGGFSIGTIFFIAGGMSDDFTKHTMKHELGHTYQNAYFGVLMPFLVTIPSVIRYWYRRNHNVYTPYEGIWFEKQATKLGEKHYGKKSV